MIVTNRKCLVIGAGSAGLAAVREALHAGLDPIAYEARSGCGGAWRYDPDPGECTVEFDARGWATFASRGESDFEGPVPPSPMYESLKTNVPTSLMQYRGTPFSLETPLFSSHDQVQRYLASYARPLSPYIRYNHRVTRLRHTVASDRGDQRRWFAEISPVDGSQTIREHFDCVMIANGHYSKPYVPWTQGLATWTGDLLHARWYRNSKAFEDKTVLVVGNSASGYDITRELAMSIHSRRTSDPLAPHLPRVYQSARSPSNLGIPFDAPDAPDWAKEIDVVKPIHKVEGRSITLEDGRKVDDIDVIIFATGYYFSFPFLRSTDSPWSAHPVVRPPPTPTESSSPPSQSQSTSPVDGGLRLHHLDDRMLFYLPDPTVAFLCLPYLVIPFPLAQLQARLASLHFADSPQLPRPLTFVAGTAEDEPETRQPVVVGHPLQYDLMDRMMEESGDVEPEPETNGLGGADLNGDGDEKGGLTGERSVYGKTSQAERDLRKGAKALRRAVLGY
ncbi:hypothetical protein JCM10212_004664 [Sporobolomyces blumeae]